MANTTDYIRQYLLPELGRALEKEGYSFFTQNISFRVDKERSFLRTNGRILIFLPEVVTLYSHAVVSLASVDNAKSFTVAINDSIDINKHIAVFKNDIEINANNYMLVAGNSSATAEFAPFDLNFMEVIPIPKNTP